MQTRITQLYCILSMAMALIAWIAMLTIVKWIMIIRIWEIGIIAVVSLQTDRIVDWIIIKVVWMRIARWKATVMHHKNTKQPLEKQIFRKWRDTIRFYSMLKIRIIRDSKGIKESRAKTKRTRTQMQWYLLSKSSITNRRICSEIWKKIMIIWTAKGRISKVVVRREMMRNQTMKKEKL